MLVDLWDGRLSMDTAEVASYIRCENDEPLLQSMMEAAVDLIRRYLGANDFTDCDGYEQTIPDLIPLAVKRACASWYENRRDDVSSQSAGGMTDTFGDMPHSVYHLVQKYRIEPGF